MEVGKRSGNVKFWWAIHNIIGHPMMEILYWIGLRKLSRWIHDETVPKYNASMSGRGE
jgi:hypothetical protein